MKPSLIITYEVTVIWRMVLAAVYWRCRLNGDHKICNHTLQFGLHQYKLSRLSAATISEPGSITALMEFTLRYWELDVFATCCNMFYCLCSLNGTPTFFPVTQRNSDNIASFCPLYFLKYWLVSEVLRKQKPFKKIKVFLLQMVNISTQVDLIYT